MVGKTAPQGSQTSFKRIAPRPLCGALGAEIAGPDLSQPLDDAPFAEVEAAFHEHIVLVFPDQHWTPAHHVAFTARFGHVEEHPQCSRPVSPEHPAELVTTKQPHNTG